MYKKETTEKYLKQSQKENQPIISCYDNDKNIISDPSAIKTINSILNHKKKVKERMLFLAKEIIKRAESHDDSKLKEPEINWLIEMDKEPRVEYGSPEYFEKMKRWDKFFKHHYKNNSHHPAYYNEQGVYGMTIVDLVEMMCDVISYVSELHVYQAAKIIKEQKERFDIDEGITQILINTLNYYYAWVGDFKPLSDE